MGILELIAGIIIGISIGSFDREPVLPRYVYVKSKKKRSGEYRRTRGNNGGSKGGYRGGGSKGGNTGGKSRGGRRATRRE